MSYLYIEKIIVCKPKLIINEKKKEDNDVAIITCIFTSYKAYVM